MIGLLQRVSDARVTIAGELVGEIGRGLMVLVGIQKDDDAKRAARLAERLSGYRVFPDDAGRMNLGLSEIGGGLLLVPQFTLPADTHKGMRASFARGAPPALATELFDTLVVECLKRIEDVQTGRFGADMQVSLTNDGPVTFWLEA